jgi:NADP-dependent 3-hydroxy acid dehydrogenase YdfG
MRELAGKVAVVTGAASGIGLAIARQLGDDGMRVMLADIEESALAAAADALAAEGIETAATVVDVSNADLQAGSADSFRVIRVRACATWQVVARGQQRCLPVMFLILVLVLSS